MKKDLLVTLATGRNIEWTKQLFSSAYFNAGWKGDYMILAYDMPEEKLSWFRKKGILVKKCRPMATGLAGKSNDPIFFSKLYLFSEEFGKWRNIVYLDSDILIRGSLGDLTKVRGFASTLDNMGFLLDQFMYSKENKREFLDLRKNYDLRENAFCAGVFAFNTDIIEKGTFDGMKRLAKKYSGILRFGDQSVLNLYFYKRWQRLPGAFGVLANYAGKDLKLREDVDGIILHFAGPRKPWDKNSGYYREWKGNLDRADRIDLKRIPGPSRVWTAEEMKKQEREFRSRPRQITKEILLLLKLNALELHHRLRK